MNDKDEQLNKLFDGYAADLQPRPDLAQKAREELARKNTRKLKPARKHAAWIFGSLAAVAVVAIFAIGVLPDLFTGNNNGPSDGSFGNSPSSPDVVSYSINDVKAVKATRNEIRDYIYIDRIEFTGYEIYAENYYMCYLKDDVNTFAYVKAIFGVAKHDGNIEISVIAEPNGLKRNDLAAKYESFIDSGLSINYAKTYENGEYMTMAYLQDHDIHYYISTIGNADGAEEIYDYFL